MKSPFDQNPEQETEQQYERNLSRNYAPSERAEIRRSDQRASYNEAVLKQRAEIAGANAEIARSKLGVMEERLGLADIQSKIAQEKAELTQNDLKVKAARELKVISDANGFLRDAVGMDPSRPSFDTQYQKMLAGYPDAAESKSVKEWIDYHVPISKARRETEALIAKEARDKAAALEAYIESQNKKVLENEAAGETAERIGLIPTGIRDGKVVFGDEKPINTGTREVTISPGGLTTVSEKRPITPTTAPVAPAPPIAPATPVAPAAPAAPGGTTNPPMDKEKIQTKALVEIERRYPALGIKNSAENAAYLAAYREMKESGMTEFFDNPEWPIELGEVLAKRNRWKRSDQPAGKPDSTMPATPVAPAAPAAPVAPAAPAAPAAPVAPAAPAAPAAPVAPAAPKNPLADIVSAGGKIKKVGDSYHAFDKDGKFIRTYSLEK